MGIDTAGHLQARQRINAIALIAERQQQSGEKRLTIRERAGVLTQHSAHGTVIETDADAGSSSVVDIGASARHLPQ